MAKSPHDKLFKSTFKIKSEATRFIRHFLPKPIVAQLDLETLILDDTEYVTEQLDEFFSDVVYSCTWNGQQRLKVCLLFEHKSYLSNYPLLQCLRYMISIWETQLKQKEPLTVVLPILFYHGELNWQAHQFSDYFKTTEPDLLAYLPKFEYILTDLANYSDQQILTIGLSMLRSTLLLFKHKREDEYLKANATNILTFFQAITDDDIKLQFTRTLFSYIYAAFNLQTQEYKALTEQLPPPLKEDIMNTYQKIIAEGFKKGEAAGIQKQAQATIERLIQEAPQFNDAVIAEITQMPLSFVQKLRQQWEQQQTNSQHHTSNSLTPTSVHTEENKSPKGSHMTSKETASVAPNDSLHFIEHIIEDDLNTEKYGGRVYTRFPPEPNGYLHIGHAKSICLNFGLAQKYGGKTNLRFDDTNPIAEDTEFVESIQKDVQWLGFQWENEPLYASNYFEQLYDWAVQLIRLGKAYVDDSTKEEAAAMRGTPTKAGQASVYRSRSVEENVDLFERMRQGEFDEGAKVLRAKIDLTSPNMHMRDPILYRILKANHHRTGDKWCIYPMYDWAHGQSDSIEKITHSICTLEFEVHRPLYEWFIDTLGLYKPQQIEFARLNLSYTIMSKRKLKLLVEEGHVTAWDDPRMPTVSGLRRRGYSPASIRNFAKRIGVARRDGITDVALLEFSVREDLNKIAPRVMAVLEPLKVTIVNYPEGQVEQLTAINNPEDTEAGSRSIPFSREIYIERADFMENGSRKYHRLTNKKPVRLKNAYIIECVEMIKDEDGQITELRCNYLPNSKSGQDTSGVKVKGTIHWVSIPHAIEAEVRLYDRLFTDENPAGHKDKSFLDFINPDSLVTTTAFVEPSLKTVQAGRQLQFMRKGYFCVDPDSTAEQLVFNKTVGLRDSWARKQKK